MSYILSFYLSNTNLFSIIVYERVLFFSPKYQQEYDSDIDIRCVLSWSHFHRRIILSLTMFIHFLTIGNSTSLEFEFFYWFRCCYTILQLGSS